ncbi:hypothetical protein FA15DRAFT_646893 [Coprinopsis marcescibilis]|uniref:Fungal pheromone STE3G-protein-coupled receptor n=1 Tax=Coprinopsis marcescibilis TaxID=230819 RepID=A0A5C3KKR7_COPMA|nr:hypothetical protein FA15DRAFT_646893 [Coprinopsis marcescibilis]
MSNQHDIELQGLVLAKAYYANFVMSIFAAGVQCFMALYCLALFLGLPAEKRKGRTLYVVTGCIIFVVYTTAACMDVSELFDRLFETSNGTDFLARPFRGGDEGYPWTTYVGEICVLLLFLLGDGLLLYRCFLVLSCRWLLVLPALTYLATSVLYTYDITITVTGQTRSVRLPSSIACILNVATNVTLTSLISFRLIKARKQLSKVLPSNGLRVYHEVTTTLIESALPLAVFGVAYVATIIPFGSMSASDTGTEVIVRVIPAQGTFGLLYFAFLAISPLMIIFRVVTAKTHTFTPTTTHSHPIVFAQIEFSQHSSQSGGDWRT